MNYKDYQNATQRTFAYRDRSLDIETTDKLHCAIGIVTEAGELLDAFKKNIYYCKPFDKVNLKEEIGDLMWYISNFCRLNGFDLEDIMKININKLKVRFPEKFSNELAENRDLEAERRELECEFTVGKTIDFEVQGHKISGYFVKMVDEKIVLIRVTLKNHLYAIGSEAKINKSFIISQ